jgi:hypothetical protein
LNWHGNDDLLLETLTAEKTRRLTENKLAYYKPYPKQIEFHASPARERLLMAGNQLGKTLAGGFEVAMHTTGIYPDWWKGRRFDRPTVGWACGVTGEVVRDTIQKILVGRPGQPGTGAIPKDAIAELVSARGIPDLLDAIKSSTAPVVTRSLGSKPTQQVVRNSRARPWTLSGLMRNHQWKFIQKD